LGHPHNAGVVHRELIKAINTQYSDELLSILDLMCSSGDFVGTLPEETVVPDIFGKHDGGGSLDEVPDILLIQLLLRYDKGRRIKKALLRPDNTTICDILNKNNNDTLKLIINN
jgi:hypothetical protein